MTEFLTTPIGNVAVWHMIYMFTIGAAMGTNIGVYLMARQDRKLKKKYDDTYDYWKNDAYDHNQTIDRRV